MSRFSTLGKIFSLLRTPFEGLQVRCLNKRLQSALHFMRNLFPKHSPSFDERISRILSLLEIHDETSDMIKSAVKELNSGSSLPQIQVIPKDAWPDHPKARIYIPTHLKSTFEDAVNLLKATGRNLSAEDEKYLHLLLTHYCGWSATYSGHMDDPWVKFFQTRYPRLKGLVPILDSMTYVEELVDFPEEYDFEMPQFFLLATSDSFFVYDAMEGEDALRTAGDSLEDVYNGLKDCRWADSSEEPWGFVEEEEWLSYADLFPHYYRKDNGNFGILGWETDKEYPGRVRKGFLRRLFGKLNICR